MPTKHPAYQYREGLRVVCIHQESVYHKCKGTVIGHYPNPAKPTDVRVIVRWDKDRGEARYRLTSLAQAPFRAKEARPEVSTSQTATHKTVKKVYKLPVKVLPRTPKGRVL